MDQKKFCKSLSVKFCFKQHSECQNFKKDKIEIEKIEIESVPELVADISTSSNSALFRLIFIRPTVNRQTITDHFQAEKSPFALTSVSHPSIWDSQIEKSKEAKTFTRISLLIQVCSKLERENEMQKWIFYHSQT